MDVCVERWDMTRRRQHTGRAFATETVVAAEAGGVEEIAATIDAAGEVARQLSADPDRIAHDLADQVTHRLFGVSLHLHGALPMIADRYAAERVMCALNGLDEAIADLRRVIFDLRTDLRAGDDAGPSAGGR
ncbi:hypothetical protein GCM10023085_12010 [Actinomadura viridis]